MSGNLTDDRQDVIGFVPETDPDTLAAAERYIRRNAKDPADAALLVDALLGPLVTRKGGRAGSKQHSRGAA